MNRSADRIDGVLKAAENFLGSAAGQEGQSTFASIRLAAEAFRKASENLDRRATEIATGLTRFTGTGARQVEALGTDARRTVNDVGRAARNLERNPSSVIFGGSQSPLPQYNGR
ncbi:MAG: phospholipid/cholesterol/gamma-HCH transport system substrate-binding protein [Sphingomonadales bacterium]|nr:phospholipid/cholesterol/gamma-HCH transport system substrate-binding protein [Sphingomonadales bacterium]